MANGAGLAHLWFVTLHPFEGGMTTRKYANLARVSRATAYRELADLVDKECLEPSGGGGRSRSYEIRWDP